MSNCPDCGDNSCYYSRSKGGMRTNGGCRCLQQDPKAVERHLRRTVKVLEGALEELDAIAKCCPHKATATLAELKASSIREVLGKL